MPFCGTGLRYSTDETTIEVFHRCIQKLEFKPSKTPERYCSRLHQSLRMIEKSPPGKLEVEVARNGMMSAS